MSKAPLHDRRDVAELALGRVVGAVATGTEATAVHGAWEETAWAGVMQTRLERRHNIFVAAVLTALPFGFIHLPLAFLSEITIASVLISLAAYILLGLFLRPLIGVVLRGSRDSLLAAGLMHSVFNRTNNDNGIAAALLNGELYRLGNPDRGGRTHRRAGTAGRAPTAQQGLPSAT